MKGCVRVDTKLPKDAIKQEIARNLIFYRKRAGMTQQELAQQLGVKHNSVSSWEKGVNAIDIDTLFAICSILGLNINDMYGRYQLTEEAFTEREREMVARYRARPELQLAVDILLGLDTDEPFARKTAG